jgi:hypothetical protein
LGSKAAQFTKIENGGPKFPCARASKTALKVLVTFVAELEPGVAQMFLICDKKRSDCDDEQI